MQIDWVTYSVQRELGATANVVQANLRAMSRPKRSSLLTTTMATTTDPAMRFTVGG
jgi:hypothetical protein